MEKTKGRVQITNLGKEKGALPRCAEAADAICGHGAHKPQRGPGWAAQLVRAPSRCISDVGLIPGHIQEATNKCIKKWNNKLMFLSSSLSETTCQYFPLSLKLLKLKRKKGLSLDSIDLKK